MAIGDIIDSSVQDISTGNGGVEPPYPFIFHIAGSVFALVQHTSTTLEVETYNISKEGAMSTIASAGAARDIAALAYMIHHTGNLYIVASHEDYRGNIDVFSISDDGATVSHVGGPYQFSAYSGNEQPVVKLADGYFAVFYSNSGGHGTVQTFSLSADGLSFALINSLQFEGGYFNEGCTAVHVSGNIYAVAYRAGFGIGAQTARIRTLSISADGATISAVDSLNFDTNARWAYLVHVTGTLYAISYQGPPGYPSTYHGRIACVSIQANGTLGLLSNFEFTTANINFSTIEIVKATVIAVSFDGNVVTIDVGDGTSPSVVDGPDSGSGQAYNRLAKLENSNIYALSYTSSNVNGRLATIEIDSGIGGMVGLNPGFSPLIIL